MHFCAHSTCCCHVKYFCMYILWMILFPLCCCCLFLLWNSQISGACFCLFHFCTLHSVLVWVVHNYLFVFSHCFLHVDFVCVIACLSYFLQWFCALFYSLLLPNCSHLHFCFVAGFCWRHFAVFDNLKSLWIRFCCVTHLLDVYITMLNLICLVVDFLLIFFDLFCVCFFCYVNQMTTWIWACSFSFLAPLFVLLSFILLCTFISDHTPLDIQNFNHMIPSEHYSHHCQLPAFFAVCIRLKTPPAHPFWTLFSFFLFLFLDLHPSAPIRPDMYTSAPIRTTFCQTLQSIMSGEISPAIGPKWWNLWP